MLLIAPTGAGKTLAGFLPTLIELSRPKKKARKAAKGRSTGKVPPKYRNPANEKDTWTGRGRQPRWVAAEIANGRKLEDLLIK